MESFGERFKRLRRATHGPLLRLFALPLVNRELRNGGVVLYRYVPGADRLAACTRLQRRDIRRPKGGAIPSDHWYRVLRDRALAVPVAFDIGANWGYSSAWLSEWAEKVYAFEPDPENCARLAEHVKIRRLRNVEVVASAVSAEAGETTLFVKGTSQHHSLGDIGASKTIRECRVPVTTLDRFCGERGIERVGFVKLDVEGFEPDVLAGAGALLESRAIDLILFEYSPAFYRQRDLDPLSPIETLDRFGYRVTHLDGTPVGRAAIGRGEQLDLLAAPVLRP